MIRSSLVPSHSVLILVHVSTKCILSTDIWFHANKHTKAGTRSLVYLVRSEQKNIFANWTNGLDQLWTWCFHLWCSPLCHQFNFWFCFIWFLCKFTNKKIFHLLPVGICISTKSERINTRSSNAIFAMTLMTLIRFRIHLLRLDYFF